MKQTLCDEWLRCRLLAAVNFHTFLLQCTWVQHKRALSLETIQEHQQMSRDALGAFIQWTRKASRLEPAMDGFGVTREQREKALRDKGIHPSQREKRTGIKV